MPTDCNLPMPDLRPIPGFFGYYASRDGGIWAAPRLDRLGRNRRGQWLRPGPNSSGHYYVVLCSGGQRVTRAVHRLVLETFVGPCPEGMEACHRDDIKSHNHLSNLRWDTRSANQRDRVRNTGWRGPCLSGEQHGGCVLTAEQVRQLRRIWKTGGHSHRQLASKFGIGRGQVGRIVRGECWRATA